MKKPAVFACVSFTAAADEVVDDVGVLDERIAEGVLRKLGQSRRADGRRMHNDRIAFLLELRQVVEYRRSRVRVRDALDHQHLVVEELPLQQRNGLRGIVAGVISAGARRDLDLDLLAVDRDAAGGVDSRRMR
jgi:hypothetical protein